MPIVITFDLQGATPKQQNHMQSMFERLGWQNLGGSSYRYPRLAPDQPVEDWFNHVVPALMLFRCAVLKNNIPVTKFTIDVQSATGHDQQAGHGSPPCAGKDIIYYEPGNQQFGQVNLENWMEKVTSDYPY
jgi:hypothetical protein